MGNRTIKIQSQVKILREIYNSKATCHPYIQNIKKSCLPRTNIIKILSRTSWGAQIQTLLKIHKPLIIFKIDYGAPLNSTAKPFYLRILKPIHNTGVRLPSACSDQVPSVAYSAFQAFHH